MRGTSGQIKKATSSDRNGFGSQRLYAMTPQVEQKLGMLMLMLMLCDLIAFCGVPVVCKPQDDIPGNRNPQVFQKEWLKVFHLDK